MSVAEFRRAVLGRESRVGKAERVWFPRWVERYATFCSNGTGERLSISADQTIAFSQMLRDSGRIH